MRNEPCSPGLAADGKTRCLPTAASLINAYADASCTIQLALAYADSTPPFCTTVPKYVESAYVAQCPAPGVHLFVAGAPVASIYSKSGTTCTGPVASGSTYVYLPAGAEIDPSQFAEMTSTTTTSP